MKNIKNIIELFKLEVCDYLFLEGEMNEFYAIWIIECDGEIIYHIPSRKKYDLEYIEAILKIFYVNKNFIEIRFVDLGLTSTLDRTDISKVEDYIEGKPLLFYRCSDGFNYSVWQYNDCK